MSPQGSVSYTHLYNSERVSARFTSIYGKHAAENIAFVNALHTVELSLPKWLIVFLPLVAAGCLLYMLVKRADTRSLLYGTAGCILCIFVSLDGVYQPTIDVYKRQM